MAGIAGKLMPRPRGDYVPSEIYDILDIVNYKERPWMCKKPNTQNIEPTVLNTENWFRLFDVDMVNADTLEGFKSSYFASVEKVSKIAYGYLSLDQWGTSAPFSQRVPVEGMKAAYTPIPFMVDEENNDSASKTKKKAYGCISYFESEDGYVTAVCKYKNPSANLTVAFKGV